MIVGICDDESRIRDILENKVRRLMPQARIVKFSSCDNLLLCSMRLDILLLDIQMPGMDGMAVLCALKDKNVDIPVIMISGHGNIETAVTALKNGAFDFIEKPFSA